MYDTKSHPVKGKFGQAKRAYRLDRIKARLRGTSESWIASIFLLLNLVKLAGAVLPCHIIRLVESFSASACQVFLTQLAYPEVRHCSFNIKIWRTSSTIAGVTSSAYYEKAHSAGSMVVKNCH